MESYFGGKGGAGVYQRLINLIPPHEVFISSHLGHCAIMRHKQKAKVNIGIDIDPLVIEEWQQVNDLGIQLVCGDAVLFLSSYLFTGKEFVYVDAPFPWETRKSQHRYRFDYTPKQHEELLTCLKTLPCKVMVSSYWTEQYDRELKDWQTISYPARTRGGTTAIEWAWMNYPAPRRLHDYRYLGESYKKREKLKLKKERWVKKLENMPAVERQMLFAAMSEVCGE